MARIETTETGLYRIPLTVTLSDSTHGEIRAFELVTCRVRDADVRERERLDHDRLVGAAVGAQPARQRAVLAVEPRHRAHRFGAGPDAVPPDGRD